MSVIEYLSISVRTWKKVSLVSFVSWKEYPQCLHSIRDQFFRVGKSYLFCFLSIFCHTSHLWILPNKNVISFFFWLLKLCRIRLLVGSFTLSTLTHRHWSDWLWEITEELLIFLKMTSYWSVKKVFLDFCWYFISWCNIWRVFHTWHYSTTFSVVKLTDRRHQLICSDCRLRPT